MLAALHADDLERVGGLILAALACPCPYASYGAPTLQQSAGALRQKAANIASGSDLAQHWHNRGAVSNAFAAAADALLEIVGAMRHD